MFYTMYLDGLCKRRHWPQPMFQPSVSRHGYTCVVRVNNREYSTDGQHYTTEALARDAAATRAYMICRNFSVNDGMYPGQKPGSGTVQGLPVAIGSGRKNNISVSTSSSCDDQRRRLGELREEDEDENSSWTSGGSSPRSVDSAVVGIRSGNTTGTGKHHHHHHHARQSICACRRAPVLQHYPCCQYCLRDAGWMSF
ncbi:hypothetical protein QM012_004309 [Aureobasidium pullulans]|uniref:DRBM domain-containing protein n=1 Tax=Aureobasidium pullulans TaxID=5580 RepID=A0ABR0TUD3_AURPU